MSASLGDRDRMRLMIEPTQAEQRLATEMRSAFGCLTDFILSGYRLPASDRIRSFYVSTRNSTDEISNVISVEASEFSGLPQYKEPIVLLAFLRLLTAVPEGHVDNRIDKPTAKVRSMLGWPQSDETDLIVHSTIRKCLELQYVRTHYVYDTSENITTGHVAIYRLIRYCQFWTKIVSDKDNQLQDPSFEFGDNIVKDLRERRLFGIDWTVVSTLNPVG